MHYVHLGNLMCFAAYRAACQQCPSASHLPSTCLLQRAPHRLQKLTTDIAQLGQILMYLEPTAETSTPMVV